MDMLKEVKKTGQSLWLDSLSREMLNSGKLANLIKKSGVTGLTSNPSIFETAMLHSSLYDKELEQLAKKGTDAQAAFETLSIRDIKEAADAFKSIYIKTKGADGFVSLEVRPSLAHNADGTIKEGERLFRQLDRPNVMIKVPATLEGVEAGKELLKKGVNINFTLIFSPDRYEAVVRAFVEALSWRVANKLPVKNLSSVASFFVSRIDTRVDEELEALLAAEEAFDNDEDYDFAFAARGRSAIANSLKAYKLYKLVFLSKEFKALAAKGAMKQRILWASTGVKNAAYRDTLYAEELLLPDSVNTLPENALEAFLKKGKPSTVKQEKRVAEAEAFFPKLEAAGIDFNAALDFLETDGLQKFAKAHESLLNHLTNKLASFQKNALSHPPSGELPGLKCTQGLERLTKKDFANRLWAKDAALWKKEPEHTKIINNSLGWLDAPEKMREKIKEILAFRDEILAEGFTSVVLLGMGGSSLAPEVIRTVFQDAKHPKLYVLDTTDPDWIRSLQDRLNIKKTLFIFASKSGGTIEPSSQFKYFWSLIKKNGVKKPGYNFAAITDPGTGLAQLADEKKFRKVFLNSPDIGGRFSALSFFGMVPAALCGADIKKLLERAVSMAELCKLEKLDANPGAVLGALMGEFALLGRDKLTLIMPKQLAMLGLWIEQLVAESTGKEGKGIVPVCFEELGAPESYQGDRFFVHTRLPESDEETEEKLAAIGASGAPVYTIHIKDAYDLGTEFFRWEAATAAAGALMGINPFDQPNVKEAKDLTMKALAEITAPVKAAQPRPHFSSDKLTIIASKAIHAGALEQNGGVEDLFERLLASVKTREYIALLAYLPNQTKVEEELNKLRKTLTRLTGAAVTLAYGPRYLHSSGQLHKGGADNALFLILTHQSENDINIIGENYTFRQLETAQALGDFEALTSKNRRAARIQLTHPLDKSLRSLTERLNRAVEIGTDAGFVQEAKEEIRDMLKLSAKKTNGAKSTLKAKLVNPDEYVLIDYPKNLENITSRQYSIRVAASDATGVEISINDQPWQPCRHSVGFWWFDWTNFPVGTHQLVARIRQKNGEYLLSKRRRCKAN